MGEHPEDREQVTEAYRRQTKKKIAALWESIGFQRFRRGVWHLDTTLRQPEELMLARRAELHALSADFQGPASPGAVRWTRWTSWKTAARRGQWGRVRSDRA
ncbi:hypothetical protein ACIG3E_23815 [Streptomyces sp. NPDC053474]|uniref:hypothetical protein n=1 Tax=Streptomyces sp. NPDC053474 TaxID=3365704 RepID=UPI0037D48530